MTSTASLELGLRLNTHCDADIDTSRQRVEKWVKDRGLTSSEESFSWYCAWDTARFVGNSYPHATPEYGMDLVGKLMAVAILLDDQVDSSSSAAECASHIAPFLQIVHAGGEVAISPADRPLHYAFAEVIRESRTHASGAWWQRAAQNWEISLIAVTHEVVNRNLRGAPAPHDVYLDIRRGSGFMGPFLDILESAAAFESPALAYYSPHIMLMRRITVDLGNFINDIFSLDKEIAYGQYDNLVLVLREEGDVTLGEATQTALNIVHARAHRFLELRAELPDVCTHLGLTESERERTLRYADALEMWVAGYEPWHRTSLRYRQSLVRRPVTGPWACDDLLGI